MDEKNNPDLLKERMIFLKKSAERWDKLIVAAATLLFIMLYVISGFDAIRYQWSYILPIIQLFGFLCMISSFILFFLVIKENIYLSRVVEIQKERGHTVITTGPYRYLRHPMYGAVIIMFFSTPLFLRSLYGLILALALALLIALRTYKEDKKLDKDLPGYQEYAKKTPYRLIPGIW